MSETVPQHVFDNAYAEGAPPWVIDEPQPVVVALEREGRFGAAVLDAGCGTGEHTLLLAERGHDVLGVDFSAGAIALARGRAETRGVAAEFAVADVFALESTLDGAFDTVLDSALFHVFDAADRRRYADVLHRVTRPGGAVYVLALAESDGRSFGPSVPDTAFRDAFVDSWAVESVAAVRYRGVARSAEQAESAGVDVGEVVDVPAWLARMRRD